MEIFGIPIQAMMGQLLIGLINGSFYALLSLGLAEPRVFVTGVTGSTGSGRQPTAGTHHPQRHGDLYEVLALASPVTRTRGTHSIPREPSRRKAASKNRPT